MNNALSKNQNLNLRGARMKQLMQTQQPRRVAADSYSYSYSYSYSNPTDTETDAADSLMHQPLLMIPATAVARASSEEELAFTTSDSPRMSQFDASDNPIHVHGSGGREATEEVLGLTATTHTDTAAMQPIQPSSLHRIESSVDSRVATSFPSLTSIALSGTGTGTGTGSGSSSASSSASASTAPTSAQAYHSQSETMYELIHERVSDHHSIPDKSRFLSSSALPMPTSRRLTPSPSPNKRSSSDTGSMAPIEEVNSDGRTFTHCGSSLLPGPPCVRNILGNEFCERFSYYGLRAILVLYFQRKLDWEKDSAISMFQYTNALAYFMPLLGGYVSDAKLGKYHTILYFSLVYVSGGVLLACAAINGIVWLSLVGLVLIGVGTGGIKPCVSSFGADQFTISHIQTHQQLLKREHEVSSFFHFFYFAINLGSVGSFIFTPLLRQYLGYAVAFAVPALLLAIATVVFWSARSEYHRNLPAGSVLLQLWQVFSAAFNHRNDELPASSNHPHVTSALNHEEVQASSAVASSTAPHNWLDHALCDPIVTSSQVENAKSVWRVLPIFSVLITFWMLFEQQGSAWTFQAESMNLHGLQPEQLGVINPVLIMLMLPLFDRCVYPLIHNCGIQFHSLRRMGVGMLVSILAFLLSAGVQYQITQHQPSSVSVFWQAPQIALISIAEILISVTGLEFAYTQAAPALKSTVTALFLLTTAIGNLLTGVLYSSLSKRFDDTQMYLLFAGLMMLNFFVFLIVAHRYQPVVVIDEKIRGAQEEQQTEEEGQPMNEEPSAAAGSLYRARGSPSDIELVPTNQRAPQIKGARMALVSKAEIEAPEEEL